MAKNRLLMVGLIIILAALACSNGTGGSVTGSRQSCQSVSGVGTCEGGYNKLSGTYTHKIELDAYNKGDAVAVNAVFSIQSGRLKATIEAPDGTQTTAEATPDSPLSLSGLGTIDSSFDEVFLSITLEAVNDEVRDINYTINFERP
jgi:hypothetical protein